MKALHANMVQPGSLAGLLEFRVAVDAWARQLPATSGITHGPHVTLLQPHPDDACLSVSGSLLAMDACGHLVTTHMPARDTLVWGMRKSEDNAFAKAIRFDLSTLDLREGTSNTAVINDSVDVARRLLDACGGSVAPSSLLAPMAVGRHPDHHLVRAAAMKMGCIAFWEDVAFWGIYGQSADDRVIFSETFDLTDFTMVAIGIDDWIPKKAALLSIYGSQSQDIWRPLRFAFTAAREINAKARYVERLFIRNDCFEVWTTYWGLTLERCKGIQYGTLSINTAEVVRR